MDTESLENTSYKTEETVTAAKDSEFTEGRFYESLANRLECFKSLLENQFQLAEHTQSRKELVDFGDQAAYFILQILKLIHRQPKVTLKLLQVIKHHEHFFSKKLRQILQIRSRIQKLQLNLRQSDDKVSSMNYFYYKLKKLTRAEYFDSHNKCMTS